MEEKASIEKISTDLLWITVVAKELFDAIQKDPEALRVRQMAYIADQDGNKIQIQVMATKIKEEFLDESVVEKIVKSSE